MAINADTILGALARRCGYGLVPLTEERPVTLDPFTNHIDYLTLNANTTITGSFIVQNDSAFVIVKTCQIVSDQTDLPVANFQPFGSGGGNTILTPILVTMQDSGSGRALSNLAVPLDSWFGSSQFPFLWAIPKVLDPNSTFLVTLQNLHTVQNLRVRLDFHGYKVFGDIERFKKAPIK